MHKLPARRKPRPVQFADARGQHPTSLYCECTYTNSLGAAGGKKSSGESWRSSFAGRFCRLRKRLQVFTVQPDTSAITLAAYEEVERAIAASVAELKEALDEEEVVVRKW